MLLEVYPSHWVRVTRRFFLSATFALTIVSALLYVYLVGKRLRAMESTTAVVVVGDCGAYRYTC